jgi:hypothetical protein
MHTFAPPPAMKNSILHRLLLSPLLAFVSILPTFAQREWPVRFEVDGREYQLFAPQPESLDGTRFSARAAISMKGPKDKAPAFGALWGDGVLELDRGSRLGRLVKFTVTDLRLPGVEDKQELERARTALSTAIPTHAPPISMDWLVAALEEEKQAEDQYANEPPEIIYRERPSALVFIDGPAQYEKMDATVSNQGDPLYDPKSRVRLERVVNTPFTIIRREGGDHYLYGSGMWFVSKSLDGPWRREEQVPSELRQIGERMQESAALTTDDQPSPSTPEIVVRHSPAELIDVDGSPDMQPVQGTSLLTLTNSSRSVFLDIASQEYYFLASGRWFRSRDLKNGPWEFVPADRLPEEFRRIPEGSNRDMVLAHVAGTDAAREAARDAHIPQTAQVDRKTARVDVNYSGAPEFERVPGTAVEFARNSNTDILRINGRYHVCDNGIWYDGPTPDGPWAVSTAVPAEVQDIPPSSPVYNVRYVYIYDHTPDVVFMGYTPGYMGSFVQHGVVIYGTGFHYRPWPGFWRPRPWTWGMSMYYDPWFGGWGMGWGWGYNWIHPAWGGWWGNPYGWGGWGWGGGWWGPMAWHPPCCITPHTSYYGHRPSVSGRTGRSSATEGAIRSRGSGDVYANTRAGVRPTTIDRSSTLAGGAPAKRPDRTAGQDHFTDAAGNVYRQNGDRTQRYDNGGWNRIEAPARPAPAQPARQPDRGTAPSVGGGEQRPQARPQQPQAQPQRPQARPAPEQIQRDRQRGIQRQQNFQQRAPQQRAPQARPGNAAPSRSPGMAPGGAAPGGRSGGGGGGSMPSRGGGGGRGR